MRIELTKLITTVPIRIHVLTCCTDCAFQAGTINITGGRIDLLVNRLGQLARCLGAVAQQLLPVRYVVEVEFPRSHDATATGDEVLQPRDLLDQTLLINEAEAAGQALKNGNRLAQRRRQRRKVLGALRSRDLKEPVFDRRDLGTNIVQKQ